MKNLRIYDILTEDGKTLSDVQLSVQEDFDWADVFDKLYDLTSESVESYSYKEIKEQMMKLIEDRFVLEVTKTEVHTLIDSLMYAQSMTQEHLDSEDIDITVKENIARVNAIMDTLLELVSVEVQCRMMGLQLNWQSKELLTLRFGVRVPEGPLDNRLLLVQNRGKKGTNYEI